MIIGAPSATVPALLAGTALAWQIAELAVLYAPVAAWVRRRIAVRRVRAKWARFRLEHPEVF